MSLPIIITIVVWAAVLVWVFFRQIQVRPVTNRFAVPIILIAIGLIDLTTGRLSFGTAGAPSATPIAPRVLEIELAIAVIGAALGVVRALTVKVWRSGEQLVRQGSWLTVVLWIVSIGIHLGMDFLGRSIGSPGRGSPAFVLLYLGVTLGAQQLVVLRRARALA